MSNPSRFRHQNFTVESNYIRIPGQRRANPAFSFVLSHQMLPGVTDCQQLTLTNCVSNPTTSITQLHTDHRV